MLPFPTIAARLRRNPKVADVDNEALDEGRFFVHLKPGFDFNTDPWQRVGTKSFGSYSDAVKALSMAGLTRPAKEPA